MVRIITSFALAVGCAYLLWCIWVIGYGFALVNGWAV